MSMMGKYLSGIIKTGFTFFLCSGTAWGDVGDEFIAHLNCPTELTTAEYISIVERFLPLNPNILEAGAHSGEDTVIFAEKWPQGQIFAFEPVPRFFQRILSNLEFKKIANVKAYPVGLLSETGERLFYYSQNCGGASSYLPDNHLPEIYYNDAPMMLPCITLDDWALQQGVDHIDFMWLDMEGAEYYALHSSLKILCTVKVIITELNFRDFRVGHTLYGTLKPFLEEQGFVLYMIWGNPNWQATGLFVKKELL